MEIQRTHYPDIQTLLAQGMGPELHWFPGDVKPVQLAPVLVGMANANGGAVVLGVAPRSARVQGVGDLTGAMDHVFQAALLADPPLVLPLPRRVDVEGRALLWIVVPSGLPNIYSLDGRYLGREGIQTEPLGARRLRQLLIERGVMQFESQIPSQTSLADLDDEKIQAYLNVLNLAGDDPFEQILLRRGCLKLVRMKHTSVQNLKPTYAALLLFGKNPQQWLPNATILAARFSGFSMADEFIKKDITGTLSEQILQAEAFVRQHLSRMVRLEGLTHQEISEYPLEAVRELLVNAVVHRDYNLQGDNIHLNIYTDRIEVQSPGGLPGPVTLDNLLEARFSRNAVIVQVLSDLGFVERLGYGLDRVVQVLRQNGLRAPRFEEVGGTFRVTLFGDLGKISPAGMESYLEMGLNPRQHLAIVYLLQNRRITNREFQELCPDVSSETLRRDLVDLGDRNLVIKVGDKRATYYILKK